MNDILYTLFSYVFSTGFAVGVTFGMFAMLLVLHLPDLSGRAVAWARRKGLCRLCHPRRRVSGPEPAPIRAGP